MHTRQQVLDIAMELAGAATDKPFEGDFDTTVLRHGDTGRWFGILMKVPGNKVGLDDSTQTDILNLKCDPMVSYGLRQSYPDLLPAWHMNKHLWITVRLQGGVPDDLLRTLIRMSYDLTAARKRPAKQ